MKKIIFGFVLLLVATGVQAQKIHPDISSVLVKANIDPSAIKGYNPGEVVYCHLTDDRHNYTEIPLFPAEDGTVSVKLCNNSIAVVEF